MRGGTFGTKAAAGIALIAITGSAASQEATECLAGELPKNEYPVVFPLPDIPKACWRQPTTHGGQGIFLRVYLSATPEGMPYNIRVDAADPACAETYALETAKQWRYRCSELGREFLKVTLNMNSSWD